MVFREVEKVNIPIIWDLKFSGRSQNNYVLL